MFKTKKYLILLALFGLAIVCLSATAHNAEATSRDWLGTTSADASVAANWNPAAVPVAGDFCSFTSAHNNPCTWNIVAAMQNISLQGGYSSTFTMASNVQTVGYYQSSGTLAGNTAYTFTVTSFGFIQTGGSINTNSVRLNVSGNLAVSSTGSYLRSLTMNNANAVSSVSTLLSLTVYGTNTIASGKTILASSEVGTLVYSGSGTIGGPGTLTILANNNPCTISTGCTAPFIAQLSVGGSSQIVTQDTAKSFGSMTFLSSSATNTLTYRIAGVTLTCTSITIQTRAIVSSATTGNIVTGAVTVSSLGTLDCTNLRTITVSGAWDTTAGTFTCGTNSVLTTGSGTTSLSANQAFYNIDTGAAATRILLSNVWVKNHYGVNGTWFLIPPLNYHINISSNIAVPADLYSGTFGTIYLNGTSAAYQVNFIGLPTGFIYAKASVTYHGPLGNVVVYSLAGGNYIGTKVLAETFPSLYQYKIDYSPAASQVMLFQVTGLKSMGIYNVSVNGVYMSQVQANFTGIGSYTLNGPWIAGGSTVRLNLVVPAVVPAVHGPDYTGIAMALLFLGLVTLFNLLGYIIRVRLIMLTAICILLPGVVWAFVTIPQYSLIPLLFIIVNVVLFVMDLTGGRKK